MFRNMIVIIIGLISLNTMAEDKISPEQAKSLHDKNCTSCHKTMHGDSKQFYTRLDRKVDSLKMLKGRVAMCKTNLGLQWFDEEVDGVVEHLNSNFYRFK